MREATRHDRVSPLVLPGMPRLSQHGRPTLPPTRPGTCQDPHLPAPRTAAPLTLQETSWAGHRESPLAPVALGGCVRAGEERERDSAHSALLTGRIRGKGGASGARAQTGALGR